MARDKVKGATEAIGVTVDLEDFSPIITDTQSCNDGMPVNDFQRVFWNIWLLW